jgi:hypothetical protein
MRDRPNVERRKYERTTLSLKGMLFDPESLSEMECQLTDLSGGGAGLTCDHEIPAGKHMVLYIQGFGRYEGTTLLHASGKPALSFTIGELKRKRLLELLHQFVSRGLPESMTLHDSSRAPSVVKDEIVRENGQRLPCRILDISLDGVSLKTDEKPEIGEIVALGRSLGKVVRHHRFGIAIEYVKESA